MCAMANADGRVQNGQISNNCISSTDKRYWQLLGDRVSSGAPSDAYRCRKLLHSIAWVAATRRTASGVQMKCAGA
jgi:hypothetical protein